MIARQFVFSIQPVNATHLQRGWVQVPLWVVSGYCLPSEPKLRFCPQSSHWRVDCLGHNRPIIWSAVDLGIEIDFGLLYKVPGAILQRKEKDSYRDYMVAGEPVVNPFDVETLVPGWYRLRNLMKS